MKRLILLVAGEYLPVCHRLSITKIHPDLAVRMMCEGGLTAAFFGMPAG